MRNSDEARVEITVRDFGMPFPDFATHPEVDYGGF